MGGGRLNDSIDPPNFLPLSQQNENISSSNTLDNENAGPLATATTVGENPVSIPRDQSSTIPLPQRQMDGDRLTDRIDFPTSSPLSQQIENIFSPNTMVNENIGPLANATTVGENLVSIVPAQSSPAPLLRRQRRGNYQTHPYAVDLNQLPNFQYPTNIAGNNLAVDLNQPPNFQYPTYNAGYLPNYYQQIYSHPQRDNLMNVQPQFRGFQNPQLYINSSPNIGYTPEVIDRIFNDGYGPNVNNFYGPGGGTFNQNQINAARSGSSRRADGSFLSLGGGGRSTGVTNPHFINRSPNLERRSTNSAPQFGGFSSFQSNIGGSPYYQNSMGGLPNPQINPGVFPNVRNRMGDLHNSGNDGGAMSSASYVRRQQANREHGSSIPSSSNQGHTLNANAEPYIVLRDRLHARSEYLSDSPNEQEHLRHLLARIAYLNRCSPGQLPIPRYDEAQSSNETGQLHMRRSNQLAGPMIQNSGSYGHHQVSNLHGKRGFSDPNPSSSRIQRRRTIPQYHSYQYGLSRPQTPPPAVIHIPTTPSGDLTGAFKPSGHQCMICKRDLAFSPEGLVEQPFIPPVVAVLACHHAFHDHCLQLITLEDQKADPSCIFCPLEEE